MVALGGEQSLMFAISCYLLIDSSTDVGVSKQLMRAKNLAFLLLLSCSLLLFFKLLLVTKLAISGLELKSSRFVINTVTCWIQLVSTLGKISLLLAGLVVPSLSGRHHALSDVELPFWGGVIHSFSWQFARFFVGGS